MWQQAFKNLLLEQLQKARQRNSSYSSRSFAQKLGVGSGPLSQYLSGQRAPRPSEALRILSLLEVSDRGRERIARLIGKELPEPDHVPATNRIFLEGSTLAIRNALRIKGERWTKPKLSERLQICEAKVEHALALLLDEGLILERDGAFFHNEQYLSSRDEFPDREITRAQKRYVIDNLRRYELPLTERDFTSMTFVGDRSTMQAVKKEIRLFYHRLEAMMNTPQAGEVYRMSIQLCPLTKIEEPK